MAETHNYFNQTFRVPFDQRMNVVYYKLRQKSPMMAMFNPGAEMYKRSEKRWVDRFPLPPLYLSTDLSATSTTGDTSIDVITESTASQSGEPPYDLCEDMLIQIDSEIMQITAIPVTTARSGTTNGYATLTVSRGYGDSTAAVHDQYRPVKMLGSERAITKGWQGAVNDPGIARVEYMQRFAVDMDRDVFDAAITADPGGGGLAEDRWRIPKVMSHLNEMSLLYGDQVVPTAANAGGAFNGLFENAIAVGETYTTGGITQAQFQNCLDWVEDRGCNVDTIVTGRLGKIALDSWYHGEITPTKQDRMNMKDINSWFPSLMGNQHPIKIIRHKELADGEILFMESPRIKIYKLIDTRLVAIAEDGSGPRHMLENAWLPQIPKRSVFKITDITGSA